MDNLNISLIQSNLIWEKIDANLASFEEKISRISKTDVILLPEMFTTGFSMNVEMLAEPPGSKTYKWMKQMAHQKNAAIVGSYIVKENKNFYNRLYFVFPNGKSEQYDKKHLFSLAGENKKYTAGHNKNVIHYKGWKICPLICYDLRFPVWSRSVKTDTELFEYDLLLYTANWPSTRIHAWDTLLQARAIENHTYCAGLNRVGTDANGKKYNGHSAIYSFMGEEILFSEKEEILATTLCLNTLQEFRNNFSFQKDADSFQIK